MLQGSFLIEGCTSQTRYPSHMREVLHVQYILGERERERDENVVTKVVLSDLKCGAP